MQKFLNASIYAALSDEAVIVFSSFSVMDEPPKELCSRTTSTYLYFLLQAVRDINVQMSKSNFFMTTIFCYTSFNVNV